jgi:hypothetical protein
LHFAVSIENGSYLTDGNGFEYICGHIVLPVENFLFAYLADVALYFFTATFDDGIRLLLGEGCCMDAENSD